MKRNLIYFICPFACNNIWRENVDVLLKYINGFNGKKIVTIAHGEGLSPTDEVMSCFEGINIEFIKSPNDSNYGERIHFIEMMNRIHSLDPNDITFYAHAKGVSPKFYNYPENMSRNIKIWRNIMYHYCLSNMNYIENILCDYSCCGCFKKPKHKIHWFFDGAFYWFRNKDVFTRRDWETFHENRYAAELYLGSKIDTKKSYCIFPILHPGDNIYKYTEKHWEKTLTPYGKNIGCFYNYGT